MIYHLLLLKDDFYETQLRDSSGNRDEMTDFFSNDKKTGGLKGHTILCFNP
jgi:hypothetical protein